MTRGNPAFSPQDLLRITDETFVRRVEFHDELPSTSDRAIKLAADAALNTPLLVLAELQTAGRGRGANRWWSGEGALTYSLVLDLPALGLPTEQAPPMSLVSALAVRDTLYHFLPDADLQLKWPNDVFANGRKVAGLLLETAGGRLDRVIVGIGVNVNNSLADAPDEIRANATSMMDERGSPLELAAVLIAVLRQLSVEYSALAAGEMDLPSRWRAHCLLDGRRVQVVRGKNTTAGTCCGISKSGALIVENDLGRHELNSGTVRPLR